MRGGTPPPPRQIREIFFCATRDRRSGILYLKVVNTRGAAQPIDMKISGASQVEAKGEVVTLAAQNPQDTNSIDQPRRVVPRTERSTGFGLTFTH